MTDYESEFVLLVTDVLKNGIKRKTRNGMTTSVFGRSFVVDISNFVFPLLLGRRLFYKGVFGEFAALIRGPKSVEDFTRWGCNYWGDWADKDGKLELDYGNSWTNFNGVNQVDDVIDKLKYDPTNRRILISSWRPDRLDKLSLPCCHYAYQFYVADGKLDLLWMQRSVDVMIGLPSDVILGALWVILLSAECGLKPGKMTFSLGDTHIYDDHLQSTDQYLLGLPSATQVEPTWVYHGNDCIYDFEPDDLKILGYDPNPPIKFEIQP